MCDQDKTTNRGRSRSHPPQGQFTERLDPRNAARLLGMALDDKHGGGDDSDEVMGELLQARLGATWNPETGNEPPWSRLLRPLARKRGPNARRTVEGLLLDPRTSVATIKAIRDHAKKRAASEDSEREHAALTTIYFAATASALVFHDVKTTTYSYKSLGDSFERLIRQTWMPAKLADLFRKAIEVCQREA
ncbi:MAG TPA: hypothetical protein PKH24_10465 [Sedimentisphaerales bacterium]|jgi:hypothetical protein|nr:hypothetical protein [Sedimentisphaerales bacterium]HNU29551.1 hypothetical protein [Sedimentisphaerales bacterium]